MSEIAISPGYLEHRKRLDALFKTIDEHYFKGFMELYDDTYTPLVVNRAISSNNIEVVRYLIETINVPASTIMMPVNTHSEIRRKFDSIAINRV